MEPADTLHDATPRPATVCITVGLPSASLLKLPFDAQCSSSSRLRKEWQNGQQMVNNLTTPLLCQLYRESSLNRTTVLLVTIMHSVE